MAINSYRKALIRFDGEIGENPRFMDAKWGRILGAIENIQQLGGTNIRVYLGDNENCSERLKFTESKVRTLFDMFSRPRVLGVLKYLRLSDKEVWYPISKAKRTYEFQTAGQRSEESAIA